MKKLHLFSFLLITALGCFLSINFSSCNSASALDVVEGVTPVQTEEWRTELVRSMQIAGNDQERVAILNRETVRLTNGIIRFLRSSGYECPINTITYHYGSGKAEGVTGGDSTEHKGKFTNQPYAIVKGGACFKDSLSVFILCYNETFSLQPRRSAPIGIGSPSLIFTIEQGKGLDHYVDQETIFLIANRFKKVVLYEGRNWDQDKIISVERARHLYTTGKIRDIQVTAGVYPGDRFDLGAMTYNGQPADK